MQLGASRLRGLLLLSVSLGCTLTPLAIEAAEKDLDLSKLPAAATTPADFARDVQPLFADRCVKCHGPEKQKGGLRLDVKAAAFKGGDDGKVILPGKSAESRLVGEQPAAAPARPRYERLTFYHNGINRRLTDVHGKVIRDILT